MPTAGVTLSDRMESFFAPGGELSASKDFEFRPQQQKMAMLIARALEQSRPVVVEAGTGVGKSLAYLVPSILYAVENKKKAVISTHTINLQEQLIDKDVPIARQLILADFKAVLMKGRGNYVCPNRLRRAIRNQGDLFTTGDQAELEKILEWSEETDDGTLSDLDFSPEARVWAQVCSEAQLCTPRTCPPGSGCFYQAVRREVAEADVLVMNHTLLFTLIAGQEEILEGDGTLFPNDFLIIDEAHTLEHVAARQLGLRISQIGLKFDLARLYNPRTKKGLFTMMRSSRGCRSTAELFNELDAFFEEIGSVCKWSQWGREFRVRQPGLVENSVAQAFLDVEIEAKRLSDDIDSETTKAEMLDLARRVKDARIGVRDFIEQEIEDAVYWVEKSGRDGDALTLNAAPINVAEHLRRIFFGGNKACVLTSATLGVGESNLGYFRKRVGADEVAAARIGSPFRYQEQMKIYLAKTMPEPGSDAFERELSRWVKHFVRMSGGRAFVLFTSYRLMGAVAEELEDFFEDEDIRLLVQGQKMPRHQLIQEFRDDITSVLFGTDSFWTGVDVPGEALSNVIVTRLPFAVPDHPLVASQLERIEAEGGNPFVEYSVPEAILKLRQGVGRLIRSGRDEGITVILDNRVLTKRYGRSFLNALPDAPVEIVERADD